MIFFFFSKVVFSGDTCPQCSFNDGRTELISVPSSSNEIIIPNTVTTIYGSDEEHNAFYPSQSTLKRFTFEDESSLRVISKYSFYKCIELMEIDLSSCKNLEIIEDYAFYGCRSVTNIQLPTSSKLHQIGYCTFSYCAFTQIMLPNTLKTLGQMMLSNNDHLTEVIFESTCQIQDLPKYLITESNSLESFTIPASVTSIDSFTERASGLKNIYVDKGNSKFASDDGILYNHEFTELYIFPINHEIGTYKIEKQIYTIKWASFMQSKLSSLILPDSVITIEGWAFASSSLSTIVLSEQLKAIYENAFRGCQELTKIELPGNLITLGDEVFYKCTKLMEVSFPASLTTIGGGIFSLCNPNISFKFADNSHFTSTDEYISDSNNINLLFYFGKEETLTIPATFEIIKTSAFYNCTTIKHIYFEDNSNLTTIQNNAFYYCNMLETFQFPPKLTEIQTEAFRECSQLKEVKINSPLSRINEYGFSFCRKLHTLSINSTNSYIIQQYAFFKCPELSSVYFSENLKELGASCFPSCKNLLEIFIPSTVLNIGESCFKQSGLQIVTFESNCQLQNISKSLFYECTSLHTVNNIPSGIQYIGEYSFAYTNISEFNLPESTNKVDKYCFQGCSNLVNFSIPENSQLTTIEFGVFSQCTNFQHIDNACDKFKIENEALFNANGSIFYVLPPKSSIIYFSFPTTLRMIRQHALLGCHNLELIFIPENSVTDIYQNAFEDCINLKSINIPSSIKYIGVDAFKGCRKLECGLIIQNRTTSYLESLVKVSSMPERCLSACILQCTINQCNVLKLSFFGIFLVFY